MKKCPKCGQIFAPDLDFCLEDGTRLKALLADSADIPTQEIYTPSTLNVRQAQIKTLPTVVGIPREKKRVAAWVYAVIGVMAIGLLAAIGIILLLWNRGSFGPTPANSPSNTVSAPNTNSANRSPTPATRTPTPTPDPAPNLISGTWSGEWKGDRAVYAARVEITETDGKVEGKIFWTIVRVENARPNEKPGTTATEFVRGTFNEATRTADFSGYRTDDPNKVIQTDRYRLTLSADGQSFSGKTTTGTISLHR